MFLFVVQAHIILNWMQKQLNLLCIIIVIVNMHCAPVWKQEKVWVWILCIRPTQNPCVGLTHFLFLLFVFCFFFTLSPPFGRRRNRLLSVHVVSGGLELPRAWPFQLHLSLGQPNRSEGRCLAQTHIPWSAKTHKHALSKRPTALSLSLYLSIRLSVF